MHKNIGYKSSKIITINNGVDIGLKNQSNRDSFRKQHAIDETSVLFSMVARWSPQKDHLTVLRAFNILAKETDINVFIYGWNKY